MKTYKLFTLVLSMFFLTQVFAQDAKYVYGPVTGISLDDMFAIAEKTFEENDVKTEKFNYSQGFIISSNYNFTILVSQYRADIEVKNTDNGIYISLINMQMKGSNGLWTDVASVMGKKCNKLIAAIGKDFEAIAKSPEEIEAAKEAFYNDPHTHYLFFKKATDLAAERWYENFMQDKSFIWMLDFSDIKKNESSKYTDFKYIVTARYSPGSNLMGAGGLYIRLYTNDDKNTMTEKGTKIEVKGKCIGFKESTGYYFIDFLQE
jgi:hypothetical protein